VALHLVIDITGHGYGHAAQVAPVLSALGRLRRGLRLTVRTALPAAVVRPLFVAGIALDEPPSDLGLVMTGPVGVDVEASANAYAALHADWPAVVRWESDRLAALDPDLLVSNVAYSSLAGAAAAGIPAVALSSLNWADLYRHYCGHRPEAAKIHGEIVAAYASARLFLQLTPHLPMSDLPNRHAVGPVAQGGSNHRAALAARLGAAPGERLGLVTLGGIAATDEIRTLPRLDGMRWLVAPGLALTRDDVMPAASLGLAFPELIRAVDVVITKPGYGTIVEAVCGGTRVVYCDRPDWPETPILDGWARKHGAALMISRADLESGDYDSALAALLAAPAPQPPPADGAAAVAAILNRLLSGIDRKVGA
jgi:hypothetical protein